MTLQTADEMAEHAQVNVDFSVGFRGAKAHKLWLSNAIRAGIRRQGKCCWTEHMKIKAVPAAVLPG
jgi:hypothetical protein